jgi:hypothetical protein
MAQCSTQLSVAEDYREPWLSSFGPVGSAGIFRDLTNNLKLIRRDAGDLLGRVVPAPCFDSRV